LVSDIDLDAVRHLARLSRLQIDPDQSERLVQELARIVEFVGVLEQLPDDGGEADDERATPLRDDVVTTQARPEELLAGAPDRDGMHLRVPAVIGEAT
jgi:aspartyl-tRNA(Asn)/glutamyl-tRNA(Gln) amidotransferase subunit C